VFRQHSRFGGSSRLFGIILTAFVVAVGIVRDGGAKRCTSGSRKGHGEQQLISNKEE
jgi:hypothetical protein